MKFYAQNIYKMMENKIGLPYQCWKELCKRNLQTQMSKLEILKTVQALLI
jgi:hypothetical protein